MAFDSVEYVRHLRAVGFTEAQAEMLAEANRAMLADEMVTKEFLQSELTGDRKFLRSEIEAAIDKVRAETDRLRAEIAHLRTDINQLTLWMGATAVAAVAALAVIIKL